MIEVLWHWFIAVSRTGIAEWMFLVYTSRSPVSGKGFFSVPDMILPALALGVVLGLVAKASSMEGIVVSIFLLSSNVVLLMYLYPLFFPKGKLWWQESSSISGAALVIFETTILVSFGTFMGWVALATTKAK